MASTLLDGGGRDRVTDKGHGTQSVGPSDTTDSGADIAGAPGVIEGDVIGLDHGANEDIDTQGPNKDIRPDRIEALPDLPFDALDEDEAKG